MAKLAKLYAAGPPEKEFKALKGQLAAISKALEAKGEGATLVPNKEGRPSGPRAIEMSDAMHSIECIERAQDGSDFSARIRAIEASIRVSAGPSRYTNGQFARNRPSIGWPGFPHLAYFFIVVLIGVGVPFCLALRR